MTCEEYLKEIENRTEAMQPGSQLTIVDRIRDEQNWAAFGRECRTYVPRLIAMVRLVRGRLQGYAESAIYDSQSKWAQGVLAELDRLAGGGK